MYLNVNPHYMKYVLKNKEKEKENDRDGEKVAAMNKNEEDVV